MGLGKCERCGNLPFPQPVPAGVSSDEKLARIAPAVCVCVPRSISRELVCVLMGHHWRGRFTRDPYYSGDRLWAECVRCGRFDDSPTDLQFRRRLEDCFIAWEKMFNHSFAAAGWDRSWGWLCKLADWLTGGRCHD